MGVISAPLVILVGERAERIAPLCDVSSKGQVGERDIQPAARHVLAQEAFQR